MKLLLAVGIPLLLCCVCGGGVVTVGMNMYSGEVCAQVKKKEPIVSRLGAIARCEVNISASLDLDDFDTFVFDLSGSKEQGRVWVKSTTDDDGHEVFQGLLLKVGAEEILVEGERPQTK